MTGQHTASHSERSCQDSTKEDHRFVRPKDLTDLECLQSSRGGPPPRRRPSAVQAHPRTQPSGLVPAPEPGGQPEPAAGEPVHADPAEALCVGGLAAKSQLRVSPILVLVLFEQQRAHSPSKSGSPSPPSSSCVSGVQGCTGCCNLPAPRTSDQRFMPWAAGPWQRLVLAHCSAGVHALIAAPKAHILAL